MCAAESGTSQVECSHMTEAKQDRSIEMDPATSAGLSITIAAVAMHDITPPGYSAAARERSIPQSQQHAMCSGQSCRQHAHGKLVTENDRCASAPECPKSSPAA